MSALATSKTGSSGDDLVLKFLFANRDGVHVVLKFPKTALVTLVKSELVRNWPPGMVMRAYDAFVLLLVVMKRYSRLACFPIVMTGVAPPEDAKSMRLICMGRGLLQDHQTLDTCKVPAFPTHPTPVNVSVFRRAPPATRDFPQAAAAKSVASSGCGCVVQ